MKSMKGFVEFIRSQGVVGLAVGFILGGSIKEMVSSFASDIINPLVGILINRTGDLSSNYILIGNAQIMWGNFIVSFIDFIIIALIIYFGVKILGVGNLDKKKNKSK
jgi:large conductance mechanosensitive channel